MRGRRTEKGFIIRVIRVGGRQRIMVHDLKSGRRSECSDWSQALASLKRLADDRNRGVR